MILLIMGEPLGGEGLISLQDQISYLHIHIIRSYILTIHLHVFKYTKLYKKEEHRYLHHNSQIHYLYTSLQQLTRSTIAIIFPFQHKFTNVCISSTVQ